MRKRVKSLSPDEDDPVKSTRFEECAKMNLNITMKDKVAEQINDRVVLPEDDDTVKYSMRADGTSFAYKTSYGEQIDDLIAKMGFLDLPTNQLMKEF